MTLNPFPGSSGYPPTGPKGKNKCPKCGRNFRNWIKRKGKRVCPMCGK